MPLAIDYKNKSPMFYWSIAANPSSNTLKKYNQALDGDDYILTKKRDGALYRALISEKEVIFQSRTVSKKTGEYVEKQENIPHICEALQTIFPPETIFVGEVCYPEYMGATISSDITKVMGALPSKAIKRQEEEPLVFYIFDVLLYDGEDYSNKSYEERIHKIQRIAAAVDVECLEFAKPIYENKREQIATWLEEGWEGGMLMNRKEPYKMDEFGKQPRPAWTSIKIKQEVLQDIDLVIVDVTSPIKEYTGKYPESHDYWEDENGIKLKGKLFGKGYLPVTSTYFNEMPGGLVLAAVDKNGDFIEVCRVANLTDQLRLDIKKDPLQFIGKVVTVGAMSVNLEKKSLRHPKLLKFRPDKKAEECSYELIFE